MTNLDDNHELPDVSEAEGVVNALLEEVGEETQAQPAGSFGGIRGRTLVLSGGASGIGRCVAIEFARCGANVAFNWVDLPGRSIAEDAVRTERELQQLEVGVVAERVDVRDPMAVAEFVERARQRLGGIHFLVNAAGVHRSAPIWKLSDEDWCEVIDANLTGAFNLIRACAPVLRGQRFGKIVNVASVLAFSGGFGVSSYAASKSGLLGLTRSAAMELGPSNVNVNAVAPGYVRTEMLADVPMELVDDARKRAALRRLAEPGDVAELVLFLCSEMARQITGQVIRIDGGLPG